MSWICENCSTVNEDSMSLCFVCGTKRSEEQILEAKRIVREEKTNRVNTIIYNVVTITGKVLFFSSIALFSVVLLIVLFLRMRNGELDDLIQNGIDIFFNGAENFELLFCVNFDTVMEHFGKVHLSSISENFEEIWSRNTDILSMKFESIITELFVNKNIKYETMAYTFEHVNDSFVDMLSSWSYAISTLFDNISDRLSDAIYNIEEVIYKCKESFSKIIG